MDWTRKVKPVRIKHGILTLTLITMRIGHLQTLLRLVFDTIQELI